MSCGGVIHVDTWDYIASLKQMDSYLKIIKPLYLGIWIWSYNWFRAQWFHRTVEHENLGLVVYFKCTWLFICPEVCWWLIWAHSGSLVSHWPSALGLQAGTGNPVPKVSQYRSQVWGGWLAPWELFGFTNIRTWCKQFGFTFGSIYSLLCEYILHWPAYYSFMCFGLKNNWKCGNEFHFDIKPLWERMQWTYSLFIIPPFIKTK